MVRLLNRLIEPTAGQVLIDGEDVTALDPAALLELRRRKMSMVFQSFALMPHLNVVDNAAFGLELSGVAPAERAARARVALEQVGLATHAESYPDELSGGMQQRVGLARALANDPDILLMDEAFSALDPLIRTEMQDELLKLQQQQQRTVIFISHDLDEAIRIGDRIAIMEGGRVVQVGTPEEIINSPADAYVRAFFRGVDVTSVLTAGDIAKRTQVTLIEREGMGIRTALERLREHDRDFGYVVNRDQTFYGVVSADSLQGADREARLGAALLDGLDPLPHTTPVGELIGAVAQAPCGLPVVDDRGRYVGVITKVTLLETLAPEND
jgi:glycine betaine/proline transport system ATP-binding protein